MATEFSRETVKRIAELGRLDLTDEEIAVYQKELAKILNIFKALSKVPLSEGLSGDARSALVLAKAEGAGEEISRMRPDESQNTITTQDFLSQCPEREGVFVRVPAI